MATYTQNLHLIKPEYTDYQDIAPLNSNMDTLDEKIGNATMGTTATTLTGAIAENKAILDKREVYRINASVNDNSALAPNRLINQWATFISYLKTFTGKTSELVVFDGTIGFPAYSGGNSLGTYFAFGIVALSNNAGTIFLTQYHDGLIYMIKYHSDSTYEIRTMITEDKLGIVAVNNAAPKAILAGQYIFHNGILRVALSDIASGATINNTNSSAVGDGGLNHIMSRIGEKHPLVKFFTVQKQSSVTFNVAINSRIRIDCFGGSNNLPGSIWISSTSSGGITKHQTGASEITVTTGTSTITLTSSAASAAMPMYCTIFDGDITEQTT